jgi:hypothetical protein
MNEKLQSSSGWTAARVILVGGVVSSLAVIIALGFLLLDDDSVRRRSGSSTGDLDRLQQRLESEIQTREDLVIRIDALDSELTRLRSLLEELARGGLAATDRTSDSLRFAEGSTEPEGTSDSQGFESGPEKDPEVAGFDADLLLTAGIETEEVDRLHQIWEQHHLEKAALLNRAMREHYFLEPRHNAELAQLQKQLHQDLEGEDFDLYLYAIGEPNRVKATRVLSDTAASEAGLQPNDVILSYDDVRILKPRNLQIATSRGRLGESVEMEVLRGGQRLTLHTRRGPLGVMMEPTRGAPTLD